MAGPALPVNVDTTYADDGADASVKLHQQHHDTAHGILNRFDTTIASVAPNDKQIPQASGGVLSWANPPVSLSNLQMRPAVGEYVGRWTYNNSSGGMLADGTVDFLPMPLFEGTYDAVRLRVSTAGTAGATVRIGVYADSNGFMGSVLAQTAAVAATTASTLIITLGTSIVVGPAGMMVWVGAVSQGGATTRPAVQFVRDFLPMPLAISPDWATDDWYSVPWGLRATGVTGAFPTTATTTRDRYNESACKVHFRRSA